VSLVVGSGKAPGATIRNTSVRAAGDGGARGVDETLADAGEVRMAEPAHEMSTRDTRDRAQVLPLGTGAPWGRNLTPPEGRRPSPLSPAVVTRTRSAPPGDDRAAGSRSAPDPQFGALFSPRGQRDRGETKFEVAVTATPYRMVASQTGGIAQSAIPPERAFEARRCARPRGRCWCGGSAEGSPSSRASCAGIASVATGYRTFPAFLLVLAAAGGRRCRPIVTARSAASRMYPRQA
jgi:hypothetical protein